MPTSAKIRRGAATPLSVLEPDARVQGVPEEVVQDIWATGAFDQRNLTTATGERVQIVDFGVINRDGGPDISGARIRISDQSAAGEMLTWTGDIEVHRSSGEWLLHRHHEDSAYNRVVLHIVLLDDRHTGTLRRADGTLLPEIVLYPRLNASLRSLIHRFYSQEQREFYCEQSWPFVPDSIKSEWIQSLAIARIQAKAAAWASEVPEADPDEVLFRKIMRALGYAKNADAMEELANRIPLRLLRSQREAADVEALLFGISGLLPELPAMLRADRHSVEYTVELRDRYERMQQREGLRPMTSVAWQYFRLRPANFPTLRIAQAAALLSPMAGNSSGGLLSSDTLESLKEALRAERPKNALRALLRIAEPTAFWTEHVRFEHRSPARSARIGTGRADRILIDAVLPILMLDAERRRDRRQKEIIGQILATLPAGSDEITRLFTYTGRVPTGARGTLGLHQLYREWCSKGRCLACAVGQHILSGNPQEPDSPEEATP